MKYVNIASRLFSIIFLAFLIYSTVQAERYGFAACLGVVFLLVAKMQSVDLFKINFGKDKSIEVKDSEPSE